MYNYRCSKTGCRKRVSKRKRIEEYSIWKLTVCPSCKCDSLRLDEKIKEYNRKNTCNCDGWPHPHRVKSISGMYVCSKASALDIAKHEFDEEKDGECDGS